MSLEEPMVINDFEQIESILEHSNDQYCGESSELKSSEIDHAHSYFWTEWSDYNIDENMESILGCNPFRIDIRQKANHHEWTVTGNILLHRKDNKWIYGIPNFINEPADYQIFCFQELQQEAFPTKTVHCKKFEKRFCCRNQTTKETKMSIRSPKLSSVIIEPPKLSEVTWTNSIFSTSTKISSAATTFTTTKEETDIPIETKCPKVTKTLWLSYDVPVGDSGTGDHELIKQINPCGKKMKPILIEVREKSQHLPYLVRNIIFHKKKRGYSIGPSRSYGFR